MNKPKKKYSFTSDQQKKFKAKVASNWRASARLYKKVYCSEHNVAETYDEAVHKIVWDAIPDGRYEFKNKARWVCIQSNKKAPETIDEWRKRLFG